MDLLDGLAANQITSSAILAALVSRLVEVGVFSTADEREVYERALLMIETQQGASDPGLHPVYEAARELIEEHLR